MTSHTPKVWDPIWWKQHLGAKLKALQAQYRAAGIPFPREHSGSGRGEKP